MSSTTSQAQDLILTSANNNGIISNSNIINATNGGPDLNATNGNYLIQCQQLAQQALLESLYNMNDKPEDDAIDLIAQRINSTNYEVGKWFQLRREAEKNLYQSLSLILRNIQNHYTNVQNQPNSNNHHLQQQQPSPHLLTSILNDNQYVNNSSIQNLKIVENNPNSSVLNLKKIAPPSNTLNNINNINIPISNTHHNTTAQPSVPSSSLLAKLNSVTSRPNSHQLATRLDHRMIELLEALYAINDNPEPAAIEMIAKRINITADAIARWFDNKRLLLNPRASPKSSAIKKRAGGRVVTFSEYQRSLLEAIFDENNYLHPQEYEELSNLIQVPSRNIKIWFKNRRSKQRLSGRIATPGSTNNSD